MCSNVRNMLMAMMVWSLGGLGCTEDEPLADENGDSDTEPGSGTDRDTTHDTAHGTDTTDAPGTDPGEDPFRWYIPQSMTWAEGVSQAYGSATVQIVDTDFDVSGVDLTLDGLNQDIPAPTVDCLDPRVTQNCLSISGFDSTGQYFELLCMGPEGTRISYATVWGDPPGDTENAVRTRGVSCRTRLTDDERSTVGVRAWETVPAVFGEEVNRETPRPVPLWISFDSVTFDLVVSTNSPRPEMARMRGYARHTLDHGDPTDVLMEGTFASTWDGRIRLRGSLKGYF